MRLSLLSKHQIGISYVKRSVWRIKIYDELVLTDLFLDYQPFLRGISRIKKK